MNTYPLVHSFDKDAIERFIDASDDSVKESCRKIIKNTVYVPFEKTLLELNKKIQEYYLKFRDFHITNNRPVLIFNPAYEMHIHKSNYWFSGYIIKELQKLFEGKVEIKQLSLYDVRNNPELLQDDIIIFSDDCIYSGKQLSETINTYSTEGNKYRFYILVPYASKEGINTIKSRYLDGYPRLINKSSMDPNDLVEQIKKKQKINSSNDDEKKLERLIFSTNINYIPSINSVLSPHEIYNLKYFYTEDYFNENTYLIYFDHKLADAVSVPTVFYLGVVPNKKNREILDGWDFKGFSKEENLDVIPLIKKCSNYTKKLNIKSPACPRPPYKEDFDEIVKQMKEMKIIKTLSESKTSSSSSSKRKLKKYSLSPNDKKNKFNDISLEESKRILEKINIKNE